MTNLNRIIILLLLSVALLAIVGDSAYGQSPTATPDPKLEKKRVEVRKMAADTIKRLYKVQPLAENAIKNAFGYAVFTNTGVKILVSGSGKGQGVAVDNNSKKETFMKMFELQAGLGFGVKKFNIIFVFDTPRAFEKFVNSGWEFGGQSDAAATAGKGKGASIAGAVSVSEGVSMFQLTDKGVALEITVKGSKYYKDDDLNK